MENNKIKILALFGKSGAGKDTIKRWVAYNKKSRDDINNIISYTTRPQRDNEIDGVDYHFVTEEEFYKKDENCDLLEISKFNNWYYGTAISSLSKKKVNIGIFNIYGIENLLRDSRLEVLPVYIQCFDRIRLLRCLNRGQTDCHEVCRRFLADEKDFQDIRFEYAIYDNSYDKNDGFECFLNIPEISEFIKDINS